MQKPVNTKMSSAAHMETTEDKLLSVANQASKRNASDSTNHQFRVASGQQQLHRPLSGEAADDSARGNAVDVTTELNPTALPPQPTNFVAVFEQHSITTTEQTTNSDRTTASDDDDDEPSSSGTDVEIEARGIESDSDTESEKFDDDEEDDENEDTHDGHHHHHQTRGSKGQFVPNSSSLLPTTKFSTHKSDRSSLSSSSVMPLINWDQHMADTDEARTLLDNDSLIGETDSISNFGTSSASTMISSADGSGMSYYPNSSSAHHHNVNPNVYSLTNEQLDYYTKYFVQLQPDPNQPLSGANARDFFCRSNLPQNELFVIWNAVDCGQKGYLLWEEFCVAMHLVVLRKHHYDIPDPLPPTLQRSAVRERHAILLAAVKSLSTNVGNEPKSGGELFVSPPAEAPPSPPPVVVSSSAAAVIADKNFVRPADFDANFPTADDAGTSRAPRQRSHEPIVAAAAAAVAAAPSVPPRVGAERVPVNAAVAAVSSSGGGGGGGHTRSASLDLNKIPLQLSPTNAVNADFPQQQQQNSPPAIPPRIVPQQPPVAAAMPTTNQPLDSSSAAKMKALSLSAAVSKQYQAAISTAKNESPSAVEPKRRTSNTSKQHQQQQQQQSELLSLKKPPKPNADELRKMPIEQLQEVLSDYTAYLHALKRMNTELSSQVLHTRQAVFENAARRRAPATAAASGEAQNNGAK